MRTLLNSGPQTEVGLISEWCVCKRDFLEVSWYHALSDLDKIEITTNSKPLKIDQLLQLTVDTKLGSPYPINIELHLGFPQSTYRG